MIKPKLKLVDVTKFGFIAEPRYYFYGWSPSPHVMGQEHVLERLVKARRMLPKGYNFKIWDMARPRAVQLVMIRSFKRRLQLLHPRASSQEISALIDRYAAKPLVQVIRPDTHRNGGALDLTIVDRTGSELFMGTDHDDLTERAALDYYEKQKNLASLDRIAKANRRLLVKALLGQGFENYPPEWWHWSHT